MVHIKKLEIYGFKSFGFKNTVVNFEKGLIAITGPNGSGKSNILDAIIFAIGENSPKAMRVDRFQSLFHDSQSSAHRLVRVSLTFDNSDRGIPIDSDNVTLTREMEGQTGNSRYYLNSKEVSKNNILELLEVVAAAPNKLNIVQQGMITRISELNSEDRRKIIEDIVGLSYFDEKKTESLKQLEESDRRLEVAMARMGEIRKRIDDLEAERNDQLRYDQLDSELKRFKAIKLSNQIRSLRGKIKTSTEVLNANNSRSSEYSKQLDEVHDEIDKLESEKTKFMENVDRANRAKGEIESKITVIVQEYEKTKSMFRMSEQRKQDINRRIPQIDLEKKSLQEKVSSHQGQINGKKVLEEQKKNAITSSRLDLDSINSEIDKLSSVRARYAAHKQKLEDRSRRLSSIKNNLEISTTRIEERIKTNQYKIEANNTTIQSLHSEMEKIKNNISDTKSQLESDSANLKEIESLLVVLREKKVTLEKELSESSGLLSKAESLTAKFEARTNVAKNAMNEDFAIAELMQDASKFGIVGLVHDLIKWDKNYERPILAASSDWMKAFVVDNVKSMIAIAAYAKEKKLPRLRIIPLDIVSRYKKPSMPADDVNIVGRLSEFAYSDHSRLVEFLFGDTMLVKNPSTAYVLARQGYRAVSVEGELFESTNGSMSLDFGSKISDLTKEILFGSSVEKLRDLLTTFKQMVQKKTAELRQIDSRISSEESDKNKLELSTENAALKIRDEQSLIEEREKTVNQLAAASRDIQNEIDSLKLEIDKYDRRVSLITPTMAKISGRLEKTDQSRSESELANISIRKNQIIKQIESLSIEFNQISSSVSLLESQTEMATGRMENLNEEIESLNLELQQRETQTVEMQARIKSLEQELQALRDREQQIIDSSASSVSVIQDYDRKIRSFNDNEKRLSRENNAVERESALLRKEISDLTSRETQLTNDLLWLGYKNLLDELEVDLAIRELALEYDTVKSRINLRADESYLQVIEGYRGMSTRRNQLESERNSIISFIEQVDKEKKDVFMNAFKKVDDDMRKTFLEMTGSNAWLQIENPEDVFGSGVLAMVQFAGKPARESTALSGGEKTIAATVFLLALQSLKPSPFYLMDEVDAHLDAQNTERLSKALLSRASNNQIIMVTLKDSTVAKASLIYGVFPREGISQIVKYRNPNQVPLAEIKTTASGAPT